MPDQPKTKCFNPSVLHYCEFLKVDWIRAPEMVKQYVSLNFFYLKCGECQGNNKANQCYTWSMIFTRQFLHWQNDFFNKFSLEILNFEFRNRFLNQLMIDNKLRVWFIASYIFIDVKKLILCGSFVINEPVKIVSV